LEVTNFEDAKFQEADFSHTEFIKRAYFRYAKFLGMTTFRDVVFRSRMTFYRAEFNDVTFDDVSFQGKATFSYVCLHKATFRSVDFQGKALFLKASFIESTQFIRTTFVHAEFNGARFKGETKFTHVVFAGGEETFFDELEDNNDLSKVSFMNTDITKVRFSEAAKWGEKDKFKVIEERWLEELASGKEPKPSITVGTVMAVYRNLRENYEYRLGYDEAGEFFLREMELKRWYTYSPNLPCKFKIKLRELYGRLTRSEKQPPSIEYKLRRKCWSERNISLTGIYYHFSRYGESITRPTIIGLITVGLSTLFWLMQSKPTLEPHFFVNSSLYNSTSHFVYLNQAANSTHWLTAFQRSFADFLPLLSLPSDIKAGIIDYIIKIVGGVLTFGLLAIALRRKFERKYTR
jgi:hypothetical protein